jgi:hypothetical protein
MGIIDASYVSSTPTAQPSPMKETKTLDEDPPQDHVVPETLDL